MNFGNSIFLILLTVLSLASCKEKRPDTVVPEPDEPVFTTEQSIEMSQHWSKDESFIIDQFVSRNNWPVEISGTGVRYYIYEQGEGAMAEPGKVAVVNFEIRLLDADTTLCYSSNPIDPSEFLIEMDNVESGLHEAITYMKEGDKAFIILPHYLAHGLLGDMDKIPPLSPVLYDIELLYLKDA
jgi:FKBP-type peptidyl-prolyl cis-trans isomerase